MDILKSPIVVGVSAALAVTVFAPVLVPVMVTIGRPIAKSLVKGGLMLYDKGREAVAMAGESVEDLVAEIRAEEATQPPPAAAQAAGPAAQGARAEDQPERGARPGMAAV
jgi:hypothetical protein